MDEKVILQLISHSIRQVLRENGSGWNEVDEARICEQLADVAWTALIVGAREALSRGDSVVLEEFGRFDIVDGSWHFIAAESLQEAKAISMEPSAGHAFVALQSLDYLSIAARLAKYVPKQFRLRKNVDDRGETPEEKYLQAIFGESDEEQEFGEVLQRRALELANYFGAPNTEADNRSKAVKLELEKGRVSLSMKTMVPELQGRGLLSMKAIEPELERRESDSDLPLGTPDPDLPLGA